MWRRHSILSLGQIFPPDPYTPIYRLRDGDGDTNKSNKNIAKSKDLSEAISRFSLRLGITLPEEEGKALKRPASAPQEHNQNETEGIDVEDAEAVIRKYEQLLHPKGNGRKRGKKEHLKELADRPAPPKPKVICKYFLEGLCTKGDACTFSHAATPKPSPAVQKETCKYHKMGGCIRGSTCPFSHDLSRETCKYFGIWGTCSAGSACKFSHQPINEERRRALLDEHNRSREPRSA